jgi:hypothetical protein
MNEAVWTAIRQINIDTYFRRLQLVSSIAPCLFYYFFISPTPPVLIAPFIHSARSPLTRYVMVALLVTAPEVENQSWLQRYVYPLLVWIACLVIEFILTVFFVMMCVKGHAGGVRFMLLLGANKDADAGQCVGMVDGSSAMFLASACGHTGVVRVLIEAGADTKKANVDGQTPLFTACGNGYKDVVELLLQAGADTEKANVEGQTPLLAACANGRKNVVELLLQAGADTEKATVEGQTPLFAACANGHKDVVELLLQAGADTTICTKRHWTPVSAAMHEGHLDIALLVQKHFRSRFATTNLRPPVFPTELPKHDQEQERVPPVKGAEGLPEELKAKMVAELVDEDQNHKSKKTPKRGKA